MRNPAGKHNRRRTSPLFAAGSLHRFQRCPVTPGVVDIVVSRMGKAANFLVAQFAHDLARRTDYQHAVRIGFALGNQGVGADDAVLSDHRTVEDDGADANQAAVTDCAAVEHHQMADGDVGADVHRDAFVRVQD